MPRRLHPHPPGPRPHVSAARCTGCGRCVSACLQRLYTLEVSGYRKHALLRFPERCTGCLDCLAACPVGALTGSSAAAASPDAPE